MATDLNRIVFKSQSGLRGVVKDYVTIKTIEKGDNQFIRNELELRDRTL